MELARIIKPGLFIFECVRTILLAFVIASGANAIQWMGFAAPGALFPIIALFLWIDTDRYRNYLPLYIAGKCIGIAAFLGWAVIFGRFTMIQWIGGDLLALGAALFIMKENERCE